jgi:fucose 4-O-acetylase-like acetyltransferase
VSEAVANGRDRRLDALKGLAIVCVVTFHASGQYFTYSPSAGVVYLPWALWLRAFLFSFMLPLFAFLSGYVAGRPDGFKPREYFWKRTAGLLLPYIAWEAFYGPGQDKHPEMLSSIGAFLGYWVQVLSNPHYEGRMWYLYVLWIALMALGIVRLAGDRTGLIVASVPLVFWLGGFGMFSWLRWVYLFVAAGLLWRRYEHVVRERIVALGIAGAVAFVPLWLVCEPDPVATPRLAQWLGLADGSQPLVAITTALPILTGAAAVAAIVSASHVAPKAVMRPFAFLGTLSLGIYVTHFPLVEMWRHMPAWFLPVNVVIALAGAVGVTLLLRAWPVSAAVFLGHTGRRRPKRAAPELQPDAP